MKIIDQIGFDESVELALKDIVEQANKNFLKWGSQERTLHEWLGILTEEIGEVSLAINQTEWGGKNIADVYNELLHSAAVIVAMLTGIDKEIK